MLTEDYCSYEITKLLEEKGFPMGEHLYMYVNKDGELMTDHQACLTMTDEEYRTFFDNYIPTITQALAMKWLREKHNLFIWISLRRPNMGLPYCYELHSISTGEVIHIGGFNFGSYEQAVEAALKYCLTNSFF